MWTFLIAAAETLPNVAPTTAPAAARLSAIETGSIVLAAAAILIVALVIAARAGDSADNGEFDRSSYFRSAPWRFIQTILIGLLALGAAWHSFVNPTGPDAVTVTFLVLIAIVTVVPLVQKIVFPGSGELDFITTQVKNETLDLDQNAKLAQVAWATAARIIAEAQTTLVVMLRSATGASARSDLVERVLRDTTSPIAELLRTAPADAPATPGLASQPAVGGSQPSAASVSASIAALMQPSPPPEQIRISAWVSARNGTALTFAAGWPTESCGALIGALTDVVDGDPASITFQSGQPVSYPNLAAEARPPAPDPPPVAPGAAAGKAPSFRGILIVPMFAGGAILGVLQVERELAQRFDPPQVVIVRALAALYAVALS